MNLFLMAGSSINMIFLLRQVRLVVYFSFYGKYRHPWVFFEDLCSSLAKTLTKSIMPPPRLKTAGIQIFEKKLGSFDLTFPKTLLGNF